jgi:FlaG/FlaF family flagellin (archaellin)
MHRIMTVVLLLAVVAFFTAPVMSFADDQPHMHAALESLKQAKTHLEQAEHDKGGHRDKAIKSVDAAIKHVEAGMKYDNKHESKKKEMNEHKH